MGSLVASAAGGRRLAACAVSVLFSIAFSASAIAQSDADRIEELLLKLEERDRKLEQRDAVIADLLRRVELLERSINANEPEIVLPIDEALADAGPVADDVLPAATVVTPISRLRAQTALGGEDLAQASGEAPGQIEVEEEDVERALERTLVQAGALLLPFGSVEVEPSFSYTRR